ncbi:MAG TPA: CDP-diacylglycerol--serine O-phosphatidyltransferase, partial [Cyclobacteriaceae bacterium]|nr:CDP-diacylglycerol--serine O-phosphatidyltransferase [Cyclobacteriaceae bacterium]
MKLLKHLPNALTCGNLLMGCIGIVLTAHEGTYFAAWCVWGACVFDFFDGFTARILSVSSPIGKELDSLADIVSFGVLPSVMLYEMIDIISSSDYLPFAGCLIAVFSALRLAKFNVDENQKDSFIGLPTPASALLITSLMFLKEPFDIFISVDWFLVAIAVVVSFLLVSPWELFALKFKNFSWADNKVRFTFMAVSVLLLGWWQAAAI